MRAGAVAIVLLLGCQGVIDPGHPPSGSGGGDATGSGAGGGASGGPVAADLPCDVALLLARQCTSCHGTTLSGGAPFAMVSRADLVREVAPGTTVASRSLARLQLSSAPMPPSPFSPPVAADVAVLEQWVANGTPAGECTQALPDAGPPPLTCQAQSTWTQGNLASDDMNPGWACQACHRGQNLHGQNPGLDSADAERAYLFMGTVFRGLNERDLCNAGLSGTVEIEITGANGQRITRMVARNGSGNFFSDGEAPLSDRLLLLGATVSLPYTATVRASGRVSTMRTPQLNGDCNACHTERGFDSAPGRIVAP